VKGDGDTYIFLNNLLQAGGEVPPAIDLDVFLDSARLGGRIPHHFDEHPLVNRTGTIVLDFWKRDRVEHGNIATSAVFGRDGEGSLEEELCESYSIDGSKEVLLAFGPPEARNDQISFDIFRLLDDLMLDDNCIALLLPPNLDEPATVLELLVAPVVGHTVDTADEPQVCPTQRGAIEVNQICGATELDTLALRGDDYMHLGDGLKDSRKGYRNLRRGR
jgi:hypothetical protein